MGKIRGDWYIQVFRSISVSKVLHNSQEFIHSYFKTFRKSHSKTPSKGFCFGKLGD